MDNREYVRNHPELQAYLQDHPELSAQLKQDPNAFMHQEDRYDRREDDRDRDRDVNRQELARFDQFLDTHRETAEQLRKDPSLVDNQEFVRNHPALQTYLQEHPELREQIKSNPNAFMQQEARYNRYDNREGGMDRDATSHRQAASFGEFLGGHSEISQRLSEDPSLVKNQEYLENHPELKQYLSSHPDVNKELMANPQSFVKSAQQFSTTSNTTTAPAMKTPVPAIPPNRSSKQHATTPRGGKAERNRPSRFAGGSFIYARHAPRSPQPAIRFSAGRCWMANPI